MCDNVDDNKKGELKSVDSKRKKKNVDNLDTHEKELLTVSLEAILRLTLLCITVRKGKKDIFISLSFSLSLTYISSSLSV